MTGEPIVSSGRELADRVAFVHNEDEQSKLSAGRDLDEYRKSI